MPVRMSIQGFGSYYNILCGCATIHMRVRLHKRERERERERERDRERERERDSEREVRRSLIR